VRTRQTRLPQTLVGNNAELFRQAQCILFSCFFQNPAFDQPENTDSHPGDCPASRAQGSFPGRLRFPACRAWMVLSGSLHLARESTPMRPGVETAAATSHSRTTEFCVRPDARRRIPYQGFSVRHRRLPPTSIARESTPSSVVTTSVSLFSPRCTDVKRTLPSPGRYPIA